MRSHHSAPTLFHPWPARPAIILHGYVPVPPYVRPALILHALASCLAFLDYAWIIAASHYPVSTCASPFFHFCGMGWTNNAPWAHLSSAPTSSTLCSGPPLGPVSPVLLPGGLSPHDMSVSLNNWHDQGRVLECISTPSLHLPRFHPHDARSYRVWVGRRRLLSHLSSIVCEYRISVFRLERSLTFFFLFDYQTAVSSSIRIYSLSVSACEQGESLKTEFLQ